MKWEMTKVIILRIFPILGVSSCGNYFLKGEGNKIQPPNSVLLINRKLSLPFRFSERNGEVIKCAI